MVKTLLLLSNPAEEQIYLEESWIINDKGGFERKKNQTEGIILMSNEISYLEFFNLKGDMYE